MVYGIFNGGLYGEWSSNGKTTLVDGGGYMVSSMVVCMVNGLTMVKQHWRMVAANGIRYLQW